MAVYVSNITKSKAIEYLNEKLEQKSQKEIMDEIFEIVFMGNIEDLDNDVFYYARAYNIISYGAERKLTNIMHDYVVEHDPKVVYRAFSKVISRFPKGISRDTPLFSALLDTQLKLELEAEAEKEAKSRSSFFGKLNQLFRI